MDADAPVNIRTLGETIFNPELSEELNLNFGFHYSATSTLMQHVLREMDGRTLFRLYAMRMGLFGEASLAEMMEEQRRDVCPVCLCDDFEELSEVLIMPCCGTRYHTYCIHPYSRCPTCRCNRPTIGWVGFQTWVSYFAWDDWRGRIDRILQTDPVRAIVPLMRALRGTHSNNIKSYAVTALLKLVPRYSVHVEDAGICDTLVDLIYNNDLLHLEHIPLLIAMLSAGGTDEVRQVAFRAICNLLADADIDEKLVIVHAGAIPPLVAMLSEDTDDPKIWAARVLALISYSYHDEIGLQIVEAGAIPPLVAMLSAGGADEVKANAALALYHMTGSYDNELRYYHNDVYSIDDNIVAIAAAGAIPPLVRMLRADTDHTASSMAALLLGNILSNTEYNVDIAREGAIIPRLVLMLLVGETAKSACAALWRLSTINDENKAAIEEAGAIPYLVRILSSEEEHFDAGGAAKVLGELSTNSDIRVNVVQEGAIPPLVAMLSAGFGNVSIVAIEALLNILIDSNNKVAIEQAGAIPLLAAKLNQRSIGYDCKRAAYDALRILRPS